MGERSEEKSSEGTLEERLAEYPELRERIEMMLALVENAAGDVVKLDDAEEQIFQETRKLGRSALQGWAERKQRQVEKDLAGRAGVTRKVKKTVVDEPAG
jgi:hypothetical protein